MSKPSSASLSVVPVAPLARLSAPRGLSAEETELWQDVVDSKPVDWFQPDSAPLLVEYVRAVAMCDTLDLQIKAALAGGEDGESVKPSDLKWLLDMRDKESKRALSTATKLRLTQQARYTPQAAATANKKVGGERPWARPA